MTVNFLKTICWDGDIIVDWATGHKHSLNGNDKQFGEHHGYSFDSAISSANGEYAFIYKKLGTKGVLLKNGEVLREINRPYYCADVYEYPAAIVTIEDKTYLIHCPVTYNQLDFEDIDTGEIITNTPDRNPDNTFHSRLEISPNGSYLMSRGWVWHPLEELVVFDIKRCINEPKLLDNPQYRPNDIGVEICTASFIDDDTILLGSSDEVINDDMIEKLPPKHISVWNFKEDQLSKPVTIKAKFGNLFAIDNTRAWDLFCLPKIIDIVTGEIVEQNNDVNSGQQQGAIISDTDDFPSIIFNRKTKQVAIKSRNRIEVLTPGGL